MDNLVKKNIESDIEALALEKLRLLWSEKNKYNEISNYLDFLVGHQGKNLLKVWQYMKYFK